MSGDTPEPTGDKTPKGRTVFMVAGPDDPIYGGGPVFSSLPARGKPAAGGELDPEDHPEERR